MTRAQEKAPGLVTTPGPSFSLQRHFNSSHFAPPGRASTHGYYDQSSTGERQGGHQHPQQRRVACAESAETATSTSVRSAVTNRR